MPRVCEDSDMVSLLTRGSPKNEEGEAQQKVQGFQWRQHDFRTGAVCTRE